MDPVQTLEPVFRDASQAAITTYAADSSFTGSAADVTSTRCVLVVPLSLFIPDSYLATPRLVQMQRDYDLDIAVRPVYPIALRIAGFFKKVRALDSRTRQGWILADRSTV
jgi:hypothetical protein